MCSWSSAIAHYIHLHKCCLIRRLCLVGYGGDVSSHFARLVVLCSDEFWGWRRERKRECEDVQRERIEKERKREGNQEGGHETRKEVIEKWAEFLTSLTHSPSSIECMCDLPVTTTVLHRAITTKKSRMYNSLKVGFWTSDSKTSSSSTAFCKIHSILYPYTCTCIMHVRCLIHVHVHQQVLTGGVGKSVSSVDLGELKVLCQVGSAAHMYSHV